MKDKLKYIKKHITKKEIVLGCTGLGLILIGLISWNVFFSRFYIFKGEEKQFLNAVKEFYKYHPEYLPKEGNIRTKTLGEIYEKGSLEELKIPKGKDICDVEKSWVKVYNDNGKYVYHTYLKCGFIESSTDHKGPEITLAGDNPLYVSLGDEYNDPGVKSVKDNKDGKIDVSKVTIDSSLVNTNKQGEYKVIYKAKDKMNNVTKIERVVKVTKNLTRIAQNATKDTEGYYKGNVTNNYVQFSGMLFKIVKANEDKTVMLISEDNIANLRYDDEEYENSNIDKYLNDVFLKAIYDDSYLVEKEYCVGNVENFDDINSSCNKKIKRKAVLLSIDEFVKTFNGNESQLCNFIHYTLSNKVAGNTINVNNEEKSCLSNVTEATIPVVKPVITLKANLPIISGAGDIKNPYKLEDYEYGKIGDNLENRIIGEYVNYSNTNFRIIEKNDKGVVLIGVDGLKRTFEGDSNSKFIEVQLPEGKEYAFNPEDKDNIGYIINNTYINYINESAIIANEYTVPINESGKEYNEAESAKITAKISLPKTYDLFSSIQVIDNGYLYLYLDKSVDSNKAFYLNRLDGLVHEAGLNENMYGEYCIKPVITISKDLKIKKGNGTAYNPYYIK